MSEVKNIPRLRFKDDTVKDFSDWKEMRLGEVVNLKHGYQFRRTDFTQEGLPIIKIGNVKGTGLFLEDLSFIDENRYEEFKSFEILNGDILMSLTGNIGRVVEVKNLPYKVIQNYRVGNFQPFDENEISKKFLKHLLATDQVFGRFNSLSNQSAQANFGKQDMDKIKVCIPNLEEQQKIADFLTAVDKRIELLEKKKTLLETYKKGVMKKIFDQEIRFKDDNGNDFPDWEENRLGEISKITIGEFVIKTKQNPESEYPVYNGGKSWTGFYDEFNNEGNKILISARGANAGFVNFEKKKFWAGNSCYSIDMIDHTKYKIEYFFFYIKCFQNRFTDYQQAANIPSVSKKDVTLFKVSYPSFKEQNKIYKFLSSIDNQIELLGTQIDKSKTWKKGLLQKMFV